MKTSKAKLRAGAALMLALWALFLLSAMVISWALDINSRLVVSGNASRVLDAEAMASSGADLALHPLIKPDSANLHGQMGNNEGYDVQMVGECGRLNLTLLAAGGVEDPLRKEILRQYLTLKGVEMNDVDTMVDSLLDWMSPPGLHRLNACPESDDYQPAHAPLTSLDDLKKICGWAKFTSKPGWDEDFTLCGQCNQGIDIAWASRDVLRAVLGALRGGGDDQVDAFLQLRRGPDGVDGTADDAQFNSLQDALTRGLGLRSQQIPQQLPLGYNLTVFRVVSVGKSGDVSRTVQMVVQKQLGAPKPTVISWKEL